MKGRALLISMLVGVLLVGLSGSVPAQTRRVIKISLSSFKFEPNIIKFNEGDTVVLQLANIDTQRPHNLASAYWKTVDFVVRGEATQGTTPDGLKSVQLDTGRTAEIEFVAKGRGQVSFVCSVFNYGHAANGMTGALIIWPPGYFPGQ